MTDWLGIANAWIDYAVVVLILVIAVELGAWLVHRRRARNSDSDSDADRFLSSLSAPSLGLLALMTGFTFSMSLSRFEARTTAVLDEANAIRSAVLFGRVLPEPYRTTVAPLLKEYAQARIAPRGALPDSEETTSRLQHAAELQEKLWQEAMALTKSQPSAATTEWFVQALNTMIGAQANRSTAARNNVPAVVFLMLEALAVLALGFSGYGIEQAHVHHRIAMVLMALMIGCVIVLILDLDRPQSGLITVSQQPLIDLVGSLP